MSSTTIEDLNDPVAEMAAKLLYSSLDAHWREARSGRAIIQAKGRD